MKKMEKIMTIIGIAVMIWLTVSFMEVNANNKIEGGTLSNWNTFQIVSTLIKERRC
jgi:hypothetical protein